MKAKLIIWIVITALIYPCISFAQNPWNMELIGKAAHDGSLRDYTAYEDYLYIVTAKNNPYRHLLSIVDISNQYYPHRVQAIYEGEVGPALIAVDSLLYIMNEDSDTLIIFSLQNPSEPLEIQRISIGQYFTTFDRLTEDLIGCPQSYNFKLINIHNRTNPNLLLDLDLTYKATRGEIMGNYLFISGYAQHYMRSFLEVFDISDTLNPVSVYLYLMNYISLPNIRIIGQYLYYSFLPYGIKIFEISDPSNPVLIDTIMDNYQILDMELSGDQLMLMGVFDSLFTIDVTDPARPFFTGAYYNQGESYNSRLIDNRLYLISNNDIISWFNVSDPSNPLLTGRYIPYSSTTDIVKYGNYVYTAVPWGGFRIFDISNPADPVGIGYYKTDQQSFRIRVSDDILFLADSYAGVRIFSLEDPLNPALLSTIFFESNAHDMFCFDSLLYMACYDGFRIVDISDPANPAIRGYYPTPHSHNYYGTITSNGSLVYTSESDSGFCIYNVSDLGNPIKIRCLDIYHPAEFAIRDSLLFTADYRDGIVIFDINDPSYPNLISSTGPRAGAIFLHDNHAYLTYWDDGLKVFDISDPGDPEYIASYSDNGYCLGVVAENDTAYVAAGPQGMWIIRNEITTGLKDNHAVLPHNIGLSNYPNPFNAQTAIGYSLRTKTEISLSIYNLLGQHVETLFEGTQNAGEHTIIWDATHFPSGIYFARLETAGRAEIIKMVLLK
jgi:hypothetical protein